MANTDASPVMIVDDELFFRHVLKKILTDAGFAVVAEAIDGEDALLKYKEVRPSLVFMDIYMPGLNGIDATREIINCDPEAKIVVCSGSGFDDDIDAVLRVGAKGVIRKPFYDDEVLETARSVLAE